MQRVKSYVAGDLVTSADLNAIQDNAAGLAQLIGCWIGTPPIVWTTSTTAISIGAAPPLFINNKLLPARASTTLLLNAGSAQSPTLANNTWYYIYAYDSSGTIGYEYSTTAPDSARVHKNGDITRAYVACFRTGTASTGVVLFAYRNRTFFYDMKIDKSAAGGLAPHVITVGGNATTVTSADILPAVPSISRFFVEIEARLTVNTGTTTVQNTLILRHNTGTNTINFADIVLRGDGEGTGVRYDTGRAWMETQNAFVYYVNSATNMATDIYVRAFLDSPF